MVGTEDSSGIHDNNLYHVLHRVRCDLSLRGMRRLIAPEKTAAGNTLENIQKKTGQ